MVSFNNLDLQAINEALSQAVHELSLMMCKENWVNYPVNDDKTKVHPGLGLCVWVDVVEALAPILLQDNTFDTDTRLRALRHMTEETTLNYNLIKKNFVIQEDKSDKDIFDKDKFVAYLKRTMDTHMRREEKMMGIIHQQNKPSPSP